MFRSLVRKTTPLLAFGVGIAAFPKDWRKGQFGDKKLLVINDSVLEQIRSTDRYKQLVNDPNLKHYNSSHAFPDQHHKNYVNTGLLFGPDLMEIDPIVFLDEKNGELTSFYHLGISSLVKMVKFIMGLSPQFWMKDCVLPDSHYYLRRRGHCQSTD